MFDIKQSDPIVDQLKMFVIFGRFDLQYDVLILFLNEKLLYHGAWYW